MMSVNLSDIAILYIKDSDYPCIISLISKNEAIDLLQNGDLTENVEHYNKSKIIKKVISLEKTIIKFSYIKIQKQKFHQHKGPISTKKYRY